MDAGTAAFPSPKFCTGHAHRALSRVAADAQGEGDHPHRVIGKCGLHLPAPGLPQGGVAAGIAGKHGHFHPRKPGWPSHGAEPPTRSFWPGAFPGPFCRRPAFRLDLQDGLNMEHRRHRSARRGHPAAFPQILQGVHRDVDAGRIPLRLQNVPDLRRCLSLGQQHLGRCGWTGPA